MFTPVRTPPTLPLPLTPTLPLTLPRQVFVAFLSEFMVDALEGAAKDWGVPKLFLGTIVIPEPYP